jgi:hypothetical protein
MLAELERLVLPPGRPVQLALQLDGLLLPATSPLRYQDQLPVRPRKPKWLRGRPRPAADEPNVLV